MRFTYAEAMTQATYYAPLAQAAEAAGYTSMTVADSLIYPKESDSKYPYTDTGDREFLEGKEFIETMVLCAHLFAVTTTLRLTPFVLKLPVRPPVLVAKQAVVARVPVRQPARPRRRALAVARGLRRARRAWEKRGKRMDECMDILRGLTSGEFFGYSGRVLRDRRAQAVPRRPPSRSRCWSAATSDAALRRAVLKGDGWMHAGGDGEELDRLLTRLAEIRKEEGDTRDDFEVHVISYDAYDPDGIKRLEDKGVTDCIVGFRVPYIKGPDTEPLEKKIEHLKRYAESIIAKVERDERGVDLDQQPLQDAIAEAEKLIANAPFIQHRAGPAGGLRLPRRPDPDGHADGVRPRPRAAAVHQPDAPVLAAGPRQPGRDLLQRLPQGGRRVRRPRPSAAPPPTCPSR